MTWKILVVAAVAGAWSLEGEIETLKRRLDKISPEKEGEDG